MGIIFFLFGAVMGSAANAIIDRLPRSESWFSGRSKCDCCKHELGFGDLIPLLSYIWLVGRCRYCHKKIPLRNFLIELFLAIIFLVIGNNPLLLLLFWVTTIIAVMDWETKLVSEAMVAMWAVLVILANWANLGDWVGILIAVGLIGGIWAISKGRAMGFGDVELAAVLGFWLGWPRITVALWMAFVTGAIVGVLRVIRRTGKMKSEIAFGPFLILGGWIAYFWGAKIFGLVFPAVF